MQKEEIIPKGELPEKMPDGVWIQYAGKGFECSRANRINDLSEQGIQEIIKNVRTGIYKSLYLSSDPDGAPEKRYFQLESAERWIFVQICDDEGRRCYSSFDKEYFCSNEEAPIECSDGQSVVLKKYTMHDPELAARCAEWFIRTGEPYPGMEWLRGGTM